jgi:hypothetical protein
MIASRSVLRKCFLEWKLCEIVQELVDLFRDRGRRPSLLCIEVVYVFFYIPSYSIYMFEHTKYNGKNEMLENLKSAHDAFFILKIYALRQKKHIIVREQKYKNAYYF